MALLESQYATDAQVARVRRMAGETDLDITKYSDEDIQNIIENNRLPDWRGRPPYVVSTTGTQEDNEDWEPTYDLNASAADIWEEKAATEVARYDFKVEDQTFSRNQIYRGMMKQCRYYRSKASLKTARLIPALLRERELPEELIVESP